MTTVSPVREQRSTLTSAAEGITPKHAPSPPPEQHPLPLSVALHLLPGAALVTFVATAAALGVPAVLALLVGIAVVIVPLELGYLFLAGRRRNGRWSLEGVVDYRERLPVRRVVAWTVPLVAWFMTFLFLSVALLDKRIAGSLFGWYPDSIRELATFEDGGTSYATWVVVAFFGAALVINGVLGPIVEELYFRGHLLPRLSRYGRRAPLLNAVLFSLYHLWTPWQNPGRIVALLPWIYVVSRKRSLQLSMAVHISINTLFLLLVLAMLL